MTDKIKDLSDALRQSLTDATFVRLTLSGYNGAETDLKKITARRIVIKRANKLSFTYTYKTRDIVKNYDEDAATRMVTDYLRGGFSNATLFTTTFDLSYPAMKRGKASQTEAPSTNHDQAKNRHVETKGKSYLHALGITDAKGDVYKNAQDKYRQIDKYIEIVSGLIKDLPAGEKTIADMGSGKGYLTFALADYLKNKKMESSIIGVEFRKDMVDLCNKIALDNGFDHLSFTQGTIENYDASATNILIALHACDTATDDAIAKGVKAGAELIVVAPCCHKQIRREMEQSGGAIELDFLLRHGTFLERQAEMVTDAMRALLLEQAGYSVKAFEFISDAHTPKNVMIVATKTGKKNAVALEKFRKAKVFFGVKQHHLEKALGL